MREKDIFPGTKQLMCKVIYKLHSGVHLNRKKLPGNKQNNFYINLQLKEIDKVHLVNGIENSKLPNLWTIEGSCDEHTIVVPTVWRRNGSPVDFNLRVVKNKYSLMIAQKEINLAAIGISNTFMWNTEFLSSLNKILSALKPCRGHLRNKYGEVPSNGYSCYMWTNIFT